MNELVEDSDGFLRCENDIDWEPHVQNVTMPDELDLGRRLSYTLELEERRDFLRSQHEPIVVSALAVWPGRCQLDGLPFP
jgi:hypothetical protein